MKRTLASLLAAVTAALLVIGIAAVPLVAITATVTLAQRAATHEIGAIIWPHGRVAITEADTLWLARMVVGSQETAARTGGPAAAARMWCAANRHVLQCDRDRRSGRPCRWPSFASSFRAYSTAISEQWSARGWCAPGGRSAGTPMCSAARMRRRASVSTLSWSTIERRYPPLRGQVEAFVHGQLPPPPGIERAAHTDCIGCSSVPRGAVTLGSNWWRCDRESCSWPAGYVRIEPAPDPGSTP